MKHRKTKAQPLTLEGEFSAGAHNAIYRSKADDAKALIAVTRKDTVPLVRAYWSGYLCQIGDLSSF